jgi:hypothetical protein
MKRIFANTKKISPDVERMINKLSPANSLKTQPN